MFEEILNVPESEAFLKVSDLLDEVNAAKAACEQKEAELQSLREETAELVAAKLAKAGADEAFVQAAKAMWAKDPQSTSQAIGIDVLQGSNPYGCNQYGEGWAGEHNGKRSTPGKPAKKGEQKEQKEQPDKQQKKEEKTNEEKSPNFSDYKEDMAEALLGAIESLDYHGYAKGLFFDGEKFSTDDKNGGLTIFWPDDIKELKSELEVSGFDSMREAVFEYIDSFGRGFFDDIDFNYFKNNK